MGNKISVTPYPARPSTPWVVNIPASIAGKRQRRFFATRSAADTFRFQKWEEFYDVGRKAFSDGVTIQSVVDQFLPRLEEGSHSHRVRTTSILSGFCERYGSRPIENIKPIMIEDYLLAVGNNNTRGSYYRHLRMLFRWAWRMELIEKNPMERVTAPRETPRQHILTPDQMRDVLLLDLPDWLHNMTVLAAFMGPRSSELMEIESSDMDWDGEQLHIRPGVQKGDAWRGRYIDMTEPAKRHLRKWKGRLAQGTPVDLSKARKDLIVKPLKWKGWPENCLRHSFASYHLGIHKDAGKTAHQMGHTSPAMVNRVYAQAVSSTLAKAWWAL